MELIEKDVITLWWHRETKSKTILLDDRIREDISFIKKHLVEQNIKTTLLDIKNDLGVYVVVCILEQEEYPAITYGSSSHLDIHEAVKHSIFEAVSCIAGLRYNFVHYKSIENDFSYPEFIRDNEVKILSSYDIELSITTILNKYDIYYSFVKGNNGYLVKAYSFELQGTIYCDTVPLTKRFFKANDTDVVIKKNFPFL